MSEPRRHHYVPQVHIKQFENDNGYNLYLKDQQKFIYPKNSNAFFFTKDLNTTVDENGEIDHSTLEKEFADKWDSKFNSYHNELILILHSRIFDKNNEISISQECLKFFFEYGIIGHLRKLRSENDGNISEYIETSSELLEFMDSPENTMEIDQEMALYTKDFINEFIEQMKELEQRQSKLKYKSMLPSEAKMMVPEKCSCYFRFAKLSAFILPDCTAVVYKGEEKMDWYGMSVNKVFCVGIPITPFLYIQIMDASIPNYEQSEIHILDENQVLEINQELYNKAYTQVLCKNQEDISKIKMD